MDKLLLGDNVEIDFEGWTRGVEYEVSSFKQFLGEGAKATFEFYKSSFNAVLKVKIYSIPKNYFQAEVLDEFLIKFEMVPDLLLVSDSKDSGIETATSTIINLELLIALLLPFMGRLFQKISTLSLFLIGPIRIPKRTSHMLHLLIPLDNNDFLGKQINSIIASSPNQNYMKTDFVNEEANFTPIYSYKRLTKPIYRLAIYISIMLNKKRFMPAKLGREKAGSWTANTCLIILFKSLRTSIQTSIAIDIIFISITFQHVYCMRGFAELTLAYGDLLLLLFLHIEYLKLADIFNKQRNFKFSNSLHKDIYEILNEENHKLLKQKSTDLWVIENYFILVQVLLVHLLKHYPSIFGMSTLLLISIKTASKCKYWKEKKMNYISEEVICNCLRFLATLVMMITKNKEYEGGFLINSLIIYEISIFILFDIVRTFNDLFELSCMKDKSKIKIAPLSSNKIKGFLSKLSTKKRKEMRHLRSINKKQGKIKMLAGNFNSKENRISKRLKKEALKKEEVSQDQYEDSF